MQCQNIASHEREAGALYNKFHFQTKRLPFDSLSFLSVWYNFHLQESALDKNCTSEPILFVTRSFCVKIIVYLSEIQKQPLVLNTADKND